MLRAPTIAPLAAALLLGLGAPGCARDEPPPAGEPAAGASDPDAAASARGAASARAAFEAGSAAPGSIEGIVLLDGEPPPRRPIHTAAEGGCAEDPAAPALTETYVVEHGRLANVFVWLEEPPEGGPPPRAEPHFLRQQGCIYRPHALALRVGEKLLVTNEDGARHNVRAIGRRNDGLNVTQSPGAPPLELAFAAPEVAVQFLCDLHPWMKAHVGVFEHPWFAVTGADGAFAWSGLPPGTWRIGAWHEALGKLSAAATLGAGSGARVALVFRGK